MPRHLQQAFVIPLLIAALSLAAPAEALLRARLIVDEIIAASYPELRGAEIRLELFHDEGDFFRTRFAVPRLFIGRKMSYLIEVNPGVFDRRAPEAGVRAILAHELAHILYFKRRNRAELLGLTRLVSPGFTARFERWTDLQAIARGYGAGLGEYRQWLYRNVPDRKLREKERNYFSPEEIDLILALSRDRPELLTYWSQHVPRNLEEIKRRPRPEGT